MKVFLSWSGEVSNRVAMELREWLPNVIQSIEPWFSHEDLEKGSRWSPEIAKELAESRAAIICVTHENQESAWLNFEAGAISNTPWSSKVCTYLFDMKSTDVRGPLNQFQATLCNEKDTRALVGTLNKALEKDALPEKTLDKAFNAFWPQLEKALNRIREVKHEAKKARSDRDIAEETLGIVRQILRQTQTNAYTTYPLFPSEGVYPIRMASAPDAEQRTNIWIPSSGGRGVTVVSDALVRRLSTEIVKDLAEKESVESEGTEKLSTPKKKEKTRA